MEWLLPVPVVDIPGLPCERAVAPVVHPQPRVGFGTEGPMAIPTSKLPPGPRLPSALQLLRWVFAPLPFIRACADRYGDTFTVRLLGLPPMVFFTDPGAIRQIFTGDADRFRSGQAFTAFETFFGPNSPCRCSTAPGTGASASCSCRRFTAGACGCTAR